MISALGVHPEIQIVLLKACFSDHFSERDACYLDDLIKKDSLSGEQLRVLPLLYRKLNIQQFSEFTQSRISGIYKHTLYRNSLMLNRADAFAKQISERGYGDTIFLKGIPNLLTGSGDIGIRPMADVDLLIPGLWKKFTSFRDELIPIDATIKGASIRSLTFKTKEGFEFDVHWYLHDFALRQSTVDQLLNQHHVIEYKGMFFRVPCLEHHLAHIIAHGMATPTLTYDARWVFDLLLFLQGKKSLDADLFKEFCDDFSCPNLVADGIQLVIKELPGEIQFNRDLILSLSNRLRRNSFFLDFLYKREPVPNVATLTSQPKLGEWLLGVSNQFIKIFQVSLANNVSISRVFAFHFSDGTQTHLDSRVVINLIKKFIRRLPFIFFRIWLRGKA